jgi:hypothetical protein
MGTKSRRPIAVDEVSRVFDDACIQELADIAKLPCNADRKRFAESIRKAARIYARDARIPTDNELHAEIYKLYRAATCKQYEKVADLREGLSPRARHLLDMRGARPSLGIGLPPSQALREAAQREEACAKVATLCQFGGSYVQGRQRSPGKHSRNWRPLLYVPNPRPHFPKRDAERDFVMWLQLAWTEAANEKVEAGGLMPSLAANPARPGPFARMARKCLKLVGADHADVAGLINELNRRRRKMLKQPVT